MNTESRLKVEMAVRARNFLRANPFGEPKADAVVAKFDERVTRALGLLAQQEAGTTEARSSRVKRSEIRERVRREPLRHLDEISKAVALGRPELAALFRVGRARNEQEFRAAVEGVLGRVIEHKDLFAAHGLRDSMIDELKGLLEAYDQAVSDADAGRRAHTGARAELKTLAKELVTMVHQLNGMLVYRTRENPELAGAWDSARNIAWPASKLGQEPSTGPTSSTTDGTKSAA